MNLSAVSTTQIIIVIAVVAVIVAAALAIWFSTRKRRTEKLRTQFGGAEYTRAVKEGGSQRKAEAALDKRSERVEALHIRPLSWPIVPGLSIPGPECRRDSSTGPEAP